MNEEDLKDAIPFIETGKVPAPVCDIVKRYRGVLDVRETMKKRALQANDGQLKEVLSQNKSGKDVIKLTVTGNTDNAIKAAFSDRFNLIYVNTTTALIGEDLKPEERHLFNEVWQELKRIYNEETIRDPENALLTTEEEPEERPEDKEAADNTVIKELIFAASAPNKNTTENYGQICQIAGELGALKGERLFTLAGSTVIYNTVEYINKTFPLNDDQEANIFIKLEDLRESNKDDGE